MARRSKEAVARSFEEGKREDDGEEEEGRTFEVQRAGALEEAEDLWVVVLALHAWDDVFDRSFTKTCTPQLAA